MRPSRWVEPFAPGTGRRPEEITHVMQRSALYTGRVVHMRLRPRTHRLSYACYWLLLDLDELPALDRQLRLFSYDRFNLFGLKAADYGSGSGASIRAEVELHLAEAGFAIAGGRILLLTMPRLLGYVFNPLSIYLCYGADDRIRAVMYEVHNTFGQRHSYLIATATPNGGKRISQSCPKRFYVSPFLDMNLTYEFDVMEPGEGISVAIRVSDAAGLLLTASLAGYREALTDSTLLRTFFKVPLLTFKVFAAIHYEALRLWWKGIRLVPRPPPPAQPVTAIAQPNRTKDAS